MSFMGDYRRRTIAFVLAAGALLSGAAQGQSNVYFLRDDGETQSVIRSANTGLNQSVLASGAGMTALVLDPVVPQLFVVKDGSIGVVDSKGPSPRLESVNAKTGLAFDPPSRTLFFLGGSRSSVLFSWNIVPQSDGRLKDPVELYQISQTSTPKYLAWDGSAYIYWSQSESFRQKQSSAIKRIRGSTTGEFPEETVFSQDDDVVGTSIESIAFSQATGLLYLCQRGKTSSIQRLNPELSQPSPLTLVSFSDKTCSGIAVDDTNGLLYVSFDSPGDGGILAINQTDGTTVTTIDRAAKMLGVGVEPLRAPSNRTVPAPPVLEVVERSVTILMEKFIFPRASRALRQSSAQVSTATARQRPEYEIRVRGNGKNFIRRTKANKFTLRGLRSGSYTAKYRVRYKQGSKQRQTKFSPEQAFTVT